MSPVKYPLLFSVSSQISPFLQCLQSNVPFLQCLQSDIPFLHPLSPVSPVKYPLSPSPFSSFSNHISPFLQCLRSNIPFLQCLESNVPFSSVSRVNYPVFSSVSSQISPFLQCLESNIPFSPVARVKIERTEVVGANRALVLKKSKRFYKKENITKRERTSMTPVISKGANCVCDAINDTSKRFLLMGSHKGEDLVVSYVVEFLKSNKHFRKAFKDIRKGKGNVCKTLIQELSSGDIEKKSDRNKGERKRDWSP